jgi:hypothetical protein
VTNETDVETVMSETKKRVQLVFSIAAYHRVCQLVELSGHEDVSKTLRAALRLYQWVLEQRVRGVKLILEDPDGTRKEIVIV